LIQEKIELSYRRDPRVGNRDGVWLKPAENRKRQRIYKPLASVFSKIGSDLIKEY
jgi:hypothetical protein